MTMSKTMKRALAGLLLSAFAAVTPAAAQDTTPPAAQPAAPVASQNILLYSSGLHLAYVLNPSGTVNSETENGLRHLANNLNMRTSIEPKGVVGIDLETITADELACFPFLFYPVTPESAALSAAARSKLQRYMDNGGLVMIDTRDYGAVTQSPRDLSQIMGRLNLRPLVSLPQDHTLTRTFFLSALPGTTSDGTIWVEQPGAPGSEVTTSVIVGGRNWAGAWAGTTLQDMSRDHEHAMRSGINIVMYALTGNYKADQTHMRAILERLGQ